MTNFPASCYINAPAKINLHLRIKERRQDGFHELESIFACLDFGDELLFEKIPETGFWDLQVKISSPDGYIFPVPGNVNLVSRAADLFRAKTGCGDGFRCVLEKRIPLGAGLGGGSSDAASALMALNFFAGNALSMDELFEMAAQLGSDVPFFLHGCAAWVSGRGESIDPLPPIRDYGILLVKPPFDSSTAEAFRCLDRYREKIALTGKNQVSKAGNLLDLVQFHKENTEPKADELKMALGRPPSDWPFFNDFLPVLSESGTYQEILDDLRDNGAVFSGLSGSGSCCFGIFEDRDKAQNAEKSLKNAKNTQNFIQNTFFLASRAIPVLK